MSRSELLGKEGREEGRRCELESKLTFPFPFPFQSSPHRTRRHLLRRYLGCSLRFRTVQGTDLHHRASSPRLLLPDRGRFAPGAVSSTSTLDSTQVSSPFPSLADLSSLSLLQMPRRTGSQRSSIRYLSLLHRLPPQPTSSRETTSQIDSRPR